MKILYFSNSQNFRKIYFIFFSRTFLTWNSSEFLGGNLQQPQFSVIRSRKKNPKYLSNLEKLVLVLRSNSKSCLYTIKFFGASCDVINPGKPKSSSSDGFFVLLRLKMVSMASYILPYSDMSDSQFTFITKRKIKHWILSLKIGDVLFFIAAFHLKTKALISPSLECIF